jgi:uncharacterized lipoprotein YmbA
MTTLRLAAAACAAVLLAACSMGKPTPQATTYVIEPPMPAPAEHPVQQTLRIGKVRVAPEFGGTALVFRVDEVRYTADYYNAFLAEPSALLAGRIADWLDRGGPFETVAQPGAAVPASYVLDAVFTELYGDFRPGRIPTAVMTAQFTLVDLTGVTPKVALESTIGRRMELKESSPDALVRAYGMALAEILAELAPQMVPRAAR